MRFKALAQSVRRGLFAGLFGLALSSVAVEPAQAAPGYNTIVASISAMQNLGTNSPSIKNVYVTNIGTFYWGGACTPDNVSTFAATGVSSATGCWYAANTNASVAKVVFSIAQLQAIPNPTQSPTVIVIGAQGGVFWYNSAGSATTNGCTLFANGSHRYERQIFGPKNVIERSWCDTDANFAAIGTSSVTLDIDQTMSLAADLTLAPRRVTQNELVTTNGHAYAVSGYLDLAPYKTFNSTEAANLTISKPPVYWTPDNFGAGGGNATDDGPSINAFYTVSKNQRGGWLILRPGRVYRTDTEVAYNCQSLACSKAPFYTYNPLVTGFGAVLNPNGAFSGISCTGGDAGTVPTFFGVVFNLRSAGGATAGIKGRNCTNIRAFDNVFIAGTNNLGIDLGNSDPTDSNTGSFWPLIFGNKLTSIGGTYAVAISSTGDTNAANILYNNIDDATVGVLVTHDSGQTLLPNGFDIEGNTFEAVPTLASVIGSNGVRAPNNFAFINNQIDSGATTLFSYTSTSGAMAEPYGPPIIAYNRDISGATVNNPNSMKLDFWMNPLQLAGYPTYTVYSNSGVSFTTGNGNYGITDLRTTNPGSAAFLYNNANVITQGH